MKKIAYLINDNGVDGRAPTTIMFASFDEIERDNAHNQSKNKNFFSTSEIIVDEDKKRAEVLAELNGLERLVLGMQQKKI